MREIVLSSRRACALAEMMHNGNYHRKPRVINDVFVPRELNNFEQSEQPDGVVHIVHRSS